MSSADLLISNVEIVDGTGAASFPGFVIVSGDRIVRVGREGEIEPAEGPRRIDGEGRTLCPGFIDVHNHSDLSPFVEPWMDSALRQGVTSLVVGNCGSSAFPPQGTPELAALIGVEPADLDVSWTTCAGYLEALDACRPAVNLTTLIGHGALRLAAMRMERRPPTTEEMATMRRLLREGMQAGALGMTSGLVYFPGMYARTEEVAELAEELAPFDGVYASHIRGEGTLLFDAIEEAFRIARHAGVPAHVSHIKLESSLTWGQVDRLLGVFDEARAGGLDATADQYPYPAWASTLSSLLPPWAPPDELPRILAIEAERKRLMYAMAEGEKGWQSSLLGVGWERIVVETHADPSAAGMSIAAIAASRGEDPFDTCFSMVIEDPDTGVIGHAMREPDVLAILAVPDILVASDASAMSPQGPLGAFPVHPRNYGTFPRVLGPCVRDGVLSLESAVRKMTSLPADRFGLGDRGRIREGAVADLVMFDPATVRDTADFGAPHSYPEGIDLVMVAGRISWDGERGERAGRALRAR